MSKEETMVERLRLIAARHADQFANNYASGPTEIANWSDFSPLEQAKASALIAAVIDALEHPTLDMVEEGIRALFATYSATGGPMVTNAYRAMLSKAKEGTE